MSKLLSLMMLMVMLCAGNRLYADDGFKSVTFKGTTSRFLYKTPHDWTEDTSYTKDGLNKFISADGKRECFIDFISYKRGANITKDDLIEEVVKLSTSVYGTQLVREKDSHQFLSLEGTDRAAWLVIRAINGQEGQMIAFIYKRTLENRMGAVCILIRKDETTEDLNQEFDDLQLFLENIVFL